MRKTENGTRDFNPAKHILISTQLIVGTCQGINDTPVVVVFVATIKSTMHKARNTLMVTGNLATSTCRVLTFVDVSSQ